MASSKKVAQTLNSQLETFIHQAITDKVNKKTCSAVGLFHVDGVGRKEEIHVLPLAGHMSVAEIADLMQSRAETHASGSDDRQKYELDFFYESDTAKRSYTFFVTSQVALSSYGADEATAKNILKQTQASAGRATEIAFAQTNAVNEALLTGAVALMDASTRQLKVITERLEATTDERDVAIRLLVQEQVAAQSRSHEYRMKELEKQGDNDWKRGAMLAAPALINSLTKKDVFPQATGDSSLLKMLYAGLEKMDPQFVTSLIAQLPEMTQAALVSRGEQFRDEMKEEAKKRKESLDLAGGVVPQEPELPIAPMGQMGEGGKS